MRRVYSSDNSMLAGHIRALLQQAGIECIMRNQHLWGGIGELPPIECWPEVWITDDSDYELAAALISEALNSEQRHDPPWQCPCGEEIEGQFTACWKCGAERMEAPATGA